jgi:hypothetical protein
MNSAASISRPNAARSGPDPNDKQVAGFEVHRLGARSIWLLGIVGDWHPSFVKFEDHGHGLWAAKIELAPGDYSYRLIVDGSWSDAPAALRADASSQSVATRFFTIPRLSPAATDQADQATAELRRSPTKHFHASDRPAQQCGSSRLREPQNIKAN